MNESVSRRKFLSQGITGVSAVWVSAHLPALVAAAEHAHRAASSATPPKFEFFTPEEAAEVEAITARIIPTDDSPGAREAGVVYFIDRGLATFATEDQKTYREGLPEMQARVGEKFPGVAKFSGRHCWNSRMRSCIPSIKILHRAGGHSGRGRVRRIFLRRCGSIPSRDS